MTDQNILYTVIIVGLVICICGVFVYRKLYLFMSIRRVDQMDGVEFEKYLLYLFGKQGYRGHMTKTSGDFGADLILYDGEEKIAVQVKRYDKPVGVAAVQQAMAGQNYYDCDRAMVATNMTFTRQAKQLAAKSNVELFDREDLLFWMKKNRGKVEMADEESDMSETEMIEIAFHARVGHEEDALLSESVIYTILQEALEDHGYYVDGD